MQGDCDLSSKSVCVHSGMLMILMITKIMLTNVMMLATAPVESIIEALLTDARSLRSGHHVSLL